MTRVDLTLLTLYATVSIYRFHLKPQITAKQTSNSSASCTSEDKKGKTLYIKNRKSAATFNYSKRETSLLLCQKKCLLLRLY